MEEEIENVRKEYWVSIYLEFENDKTLSYTDIRNKIGVSCVAVIQRNFKKYCGAKDEIRYSYKRYKKDVRRFNI